MSRAPVDIASFGLVAIVSAISSASANANAGAGANADANPEAGDNAKANTDSYVSGNSNSNSNSNNGNTIAIATATATATALRIALPIAIITTVLTLLPTPSIGADGHDHGSPATALSTTGPHRQPDGSVFLPKPAQRQLSVRTVVAGAVTQLPLTVELNGTVAVDPNAGGKVQALLAGRLVPGPRGLPALGQAVRKGDVLAHVAASAAPIERANQAAQLAELRAARTLAQQRAARLQELADTVPRKDIEAAQSDVASLSARIAALAQGTGLGSRDALLAPASGVIASAHAVAGQVLNAGDLVFEIVDPTQLHIQALSFDPALATNIAAASLVDVAGLARPEPGTPATRHVPLVLAGAGRSLRDQALPLIFQAEGAALRQLAVGQPVRVLVQTRTRSSGIALPRAALVRNAANQTIVWVKTAPEHFAPRLVTTVALDGVAVAVTSGLQPGDRVALQGATLINQVR